MNLSSRRIVTLAFALAASTLLTLQNASAQTNPPAAPAGDQTRGKAAFMSYGCYECHGTVAQGNYFGAPHLAPHPIPFAALLGYIRKPAGQMPSYAASILPEKDVSDI